MTRLTLHLEALFVFIASIVAYYLLGYSWLLFAILLLSPDLSMVGYFFNNKTGAQLYNLFHTYMIPILLLTIGYFSAKDYLMSISLIWIAHIAMDRTLGYGFKYETDFKDTHLQRL